MDKQASILISLEPRMIRWIKSQRMILMAAHADGQLDYINPITTISAGSVIR